MALLFGDLGAVLLPGVAATPETDVVGGPAFVLWKKKRKKERMDPCSVGGGELI